jgi:fucose permease
MPRLESRRIALLNATADAGIFVFGIVMALLGAILPAMAGRLDFEIADIGTLFLVMNGAMLSASLVLGLAMDRFGMKPPIAVGAVLVTAALLVVARATALSHLFVAVVLLGIGGGALNGATNTLVADLYDDPRRKNAALNELGVYFGFGALLLPFAIGTLLARYPLSYLLGAAAFPCALVAIVAASLRFPAPKQTHRLPFSEMLSFVRHPLVAILAMLLFFQSGVEFTLGGFISTYLTREMAAPVSLASWVLAAYWAAIMSARVALSRLASGVSPYRILMFCAAGALVSALLAATATTPTVAAVGIGGIGLSLAGVFPAALGVAGAKFEAHSGTVFGILFAIALSGGMSVPWAAGHIGGVAGLRSVFVLVAACYGAILVLSVAAARLDRIGQRQAPIVDAGV